MIPLKDENNTISYPLIRLIILIICCIVFFIQITSDNNFLINYYGFKPASIFNDLGNTNFFLITLITSIFMHGGWLHLIGNMIYLWIFADNVEDKLGKKDIRLFLSFVGCYRFIISCNCRHKFPSSNDRCFGCYCRNIRCLPLLFSRAKVLVLIPFFIFFTVRVPAYILLIFWFIYQFINLPVQNSSVAWLAHIGGFIFGYLFAILYKPKSKVKGKSIFVKKR